MAVDFFFIIFYWPIFFLGFVCVCVCVSVCVLLSLSFFSLFVYFMCSFHMIAGRVRFILPLVGNKDLVYKIKTKELYIKFLSVGKEWAVINELFIILYI